MYQGMCFMMEYLMLSIFNFTLTKHQKTRRIVMIVLTDDTAVDFTRNSEVV